MASKSPPGAIGLMIGIKMQDDACDVPPVGAIGVSVEQPQVSHQVFLIVAGQYGTRGRGIGYIWIKRRLLYGRSRNVVDSTNFAWSSAAY